MRRASFFKPQVAKGKVIDTEIRNQRKIIFALAFSGDIEQCPGPMTDFMKFTNTRGIKIIQQNSRGLFQSFKIFKSLSPNTANQK